MIPVSEMPAGRDLDALVAEKVLGARVFRSLTELEQVDAAASHKALAHGFPMVTPTPMGPFAPPRPYSTDIAAAWEVVEQLTRTTKQWFEYEQSCVTYEAIFRHEGGGYRDFEVREEAESAPLAICRAALKAMGVP